MLKEFSIWMTCNLKIEPMRGLVATLKQADTAYFRDGHPIMSGQEYGVAVSLLRNRNRILASFSPTPRSKRCREKFWKV